LAWVAGICGRTGAPIDAERISNGHRIPAMAMIEVDGCRQNSQCLKALRTADPEIGVASVRRAASLPFHL
jgi:hypothetical protein